MGLFKPRFPNDAQGLAIVGATGSGKTQTMAWHLSGRSYTEMPWCVFEFKGDELLNSIEGAQHLNTSSEVPTKPGLYIIHAQPEDPNMEDQMLKIWENGNTGVCVDEGYMVPRNSKGFRYILTQGRSLHIPWIVCSQRPVWMDRFVFSEAQFFQVFRLQHNKDLKNVNEFIPYDLDRRLPEYYSYYYDVGKNQLDVLSRAPDADAILDTFDTRLRRLAKVV